MASGCTLIHICHEKKLPKCKDLRGDHSSSSAKRPSHCPLLDEGSLAFQDLQRLLEASDFRLITCLARLVGLCFCNAIRFNLGQVLHHSIKLLLCVGAV